MKRGRSADSQAGPRRQLLATAPALEVYFNDPSAPARWTAPSGRVRTGTIPVNAGARAGSRVRIWVTGSGQLTHTLTNAVLAEVPRSGPSNRSAAAWIARPAVKLRRSPKPQPGTTNTVWSL